MPAEPPSSARCCPVCWEPLTSTNPQRIYCSDRCRKTAFERRHAIPNTPTAPASPPSPAPVAVRACPHCGEHVSIVALLTTPEAARPSVPEPGVIPLRRA